MSDLRYSFRGTTPPALPSKRLFTDEYKDSRRCDPPRKPSPANPPPRSIFQGANLAKRHLTKPQLKKQLSHYNNQILRTFLIKIFFSMAAVVLINIVTGDNTQIVVVSNVALVLVVVQLNLGYQAFGWKTVKVVKEVLKLTLYCANFGIFFNSILQHNYINIQVLSIVLFNAALNYILLNILRPLLTVGQLPSERQPYMSLIDKIILQITLYFRSFASIFQVGRPVIIANLVFWISVVFYVMATQQEELFYTLLSYPVLRAYLASVVLLQILLHLLTLINRKLPIELLLPNKKQLSLNLLRLDPSAPNNRQILSEHEKYIWRNCQLFWDGDFLAHRYTINYELVENYLMREMKEVERETATIRGKMEVFRKQQRDDGEQEGEGRGSLSSWKELKNLYFLAVLLQRRQILWSIVSQIGTFQSLGTKSPIHLQPLIRSLSHISTSLKKITTMSPIFELGRCFQAKQKQLDEIVNAYIQQ